MRPHGQEKQKKKGETGSLRIYDDSPVAIFGGDEGRENTRFAKAKLYFSEQIRGLPFCTPRYAGVAVAHGGFLDRWEVAPGYGNR